MLKIGSRVPEFSIMDSEKQPFTNVTIAGKRTLLLFFPAAFTSVCTKELCAVRDDITRYNDLQVDVVGISTDSLYVLAKYKEEQGLNFKLAADYNKEMCAAFDSQYEVFAFGMKGTAKRSAFSIDENGIICYAEVLASAGDIPNFKAITEVLEKMGVNS